jgi:hypothetical protein
MRNGEFEAYTRDPKNSSTANDNEDAPDIESCKRSNDTLTMAIVLLRNALTFRTFEVVLGVKRVEQ